MHSADTNDGFKAPDLNTSLQSLALEEKFALLIGLLALYGDGVVSDSEIEVIKEILGSLTYHPSGLIHRDPSDEELCLNEKVAWLLVFLEDTFTGAGSLSDEEIEQLFEELTKSLEADIARGYDKYKDQRTVALAVYDALNTIASADGDLSENEKHLLKAHRRASKYHLSFWQWTFAIGIFGVIIFVIYRILFG